MIERIAYCSVQVSRRSPVDGHRYSAPCARTATWELTTTHNIYLLCTQHKKVWERDVRGLRNLGMVTSDYESPTKPTFRFRDLSEHRTK